MATLVAMNCPCCGRTVKDPRVLRNAPQRTRAQIVVGLVREGLSQKAIAGLLGWNYTTVRSLLAYARNMQGAVTCD